MEPLEVMTITAGPGAGAGVGAVAVDGVGATGAGAAGTPAAGLPLALAVSTAVVVPSLPPPPQACTARTNAAIDQRHVPVVEWMSLFFMTASLSTERPPL